MRKHLWIAAFAVALVLAQVAASARPIKLEYKFRPGETCKYKLVLTTSGTQGKSTVPVGAKVTAALKQKTLSVSKDGSAKIQFAIDSVRMTMPGMAKPMEMGKMPPITLVMSKSGVSKVIGPRGAGMPGLDQIPGGGMLGSTVLPTKPVSVGQTWTQPLPAPMTGKAIYRLVSDSARVGSQRAAKITYSMSGNVDTGAAMRQAGAASPPPMPGLGKVPFTGQFAIYLVPATGKMLRTDGAMKMNIKVPLPPESPKAPRRFTKMDLNMKMEMFLVP